MTRALNFVNILRIKSNVKVKPITRGNMIH